MSLASFLFDAPTHAAPRRDFLSHFPTEISFRLTAGEHVCGRRQGHPLQQARQFVNHHRIFRFRRPISEETSRAQFITRNPPTHSPLLVPAPRRTSWKCSRLPLISSDRWSVLLDLSILCGGLLVLNTHPSFAAPRYSCRARVIHEEFAPPWVTLFALTFLDRRPCFCYRGC